MFIVLIEIFINEIPRSTIALAACASLCSLKDDFNAGFALEVVLKDAYGVYHDN